VKWEKGKIAEERYHFYSVRREPKEKINAH
jgi:hypothetical protein